VLFGWVVGAFIVSLVLGYWHVPADPRLTPGDLLLLPTRAARIVIVTIGAIGLMVDLGPALQRARSRILRQRGGPAASIGIVIDEASGQAAARRAAADLERRRLAGELHADVVPAVRAALRDVEAGASLDRVAESLRSVADELDRLVDDRSSVVLETLGLVPALETLAERIEARHDVAVVIGVDEPPSTPAVRQGPPGDRPPAQVEAAAYLVARLAIDNAIRHGGARTIDLAISSSPDALTLVIEDDGRSISPADRDAAMTRGRRGLADMEGAAAGIAGSLTVAPSATRGTRVRLAWQALR
jgi:signal transduction histidine kinase